ncbi:MAG: hypothetical protein M1482_03540, partial [Chloroflexi bacterium]|nr:hypothetical protein [Chloroflexota bacterium]
YRPAIDAGALERFRSHVRELGLNFEEDELTVLATLDTPARVQEFLNTQVYYNFDHSAVEQEETARPPRLVLRSGVAHCFEGAIFAFAVDWLHGHAPRWALLEASQDSEHNLVVLQDPQTGLYGCNAHSADVGLDGRPCEYESVRAMAESYHPYYFSDRTRIPTDISVVGYSDPFDFVGRFGYRWMDAQEMLWDIYYTYIDDTVTFHYLFDDSGETHLYPVLRALKEGWIAFDQQGKPFVEVSRLPSEARALWAKFWELHGDNRTYRRPRGKEAELEQVFMRLTGTTPIDLDDNAFDLQFYLAAGYRVEDLMRKER